MKLFGSFPSPYGVSVRVHKAEGGEELLFTADATAICAGIYDPRDRERFTRDAVAAGSCPLSRLADYGGRRPPHIALPRPMSPATLLVPVKVAPDIPLDAWINVVMDQSRWCDRADGLLTAIESNFAQSDDAAFEPILVLGLRILLTSALEHLAEKEIDCLEAAAFYAVSTHEEWSTPALRWLEPVARTWWPDWLQARPIFGRLGEHCDELPTWFRGRA